MLIGYDARKWSNAFWDAWPSSRRKQYLINTACKVPLSVDPLVWPSIFGYAVECGLPKVQQEKLAITGPTRPEFVGIHDPFWQNLDDLRKQAILSDIDCQQVAYLMAYRLSSNDRVDDVSSSHDVFEHIGFDVADLGFVSSLTNCGYEPHERIRLQQTYLENLNPWHLFASRDIANKYQKESDLLVPEHAPFYVFSLYAIIPS